MGERLDDESVVNDGGVEGKFCRRAEFPVDEIGGFGDHER
jgi:hypothetical protein